jgi:hypothetical protein
MNFTKYLEENVTEVLFESSRKKVLKDLITKALEVVKTKQPKGGIVMAKFDLDQFPGYDFDLQFSNKNERKAIEKDAKEIMKQSPVKGYTFNQVGLNTFLNDVSVWFSVKQGNPYTKIEKKDLLKFAKSLDFRSIKEMSQDKIKPVMAYVKDDKDILETVIVLVDKAGMTFAINEYGEQIDLPRDFKKYVKGTK